MFSSQVIRYHYTVTRALCLWMFPRFVLGAERLWFSLMVLASQGDRKLSCLGWKKCVLPIKPCYFAPVFTQWNSFSLIASYWHAWFGLGCKLCREDPNENSKASFRGGNYELPFHLMSVFRENWCFNPFGHWWNHLLLSVVADGEKPW